MSELQMQAVRIVPRCTAGLSVLGSGYILYSVLWNDNKCDRYYHCCSRWCCCCHRGGGGGGTGDHDSGDDDLTNNTPQQQLRRCQRKRSSTSGIRPTRVRRHNAILGRNLLLGMSLADLLSSCSYVIGDIAFPQENGGLGNQSTCNFQGFLCNLQVGAALYSAFLAWYYCLYIRYNWRQEQIRKVFEPIAHACSWLFVIGTGVASIVKQLYHPHWIRCYISGPNTNMYMWAVFFVPIWASMFAGSIAMLLIYRTVRATEAKSYFHTFRRQSMMTTPPQQLVVTNNNNNSNNGNAQSSSQRSISFISDIKDNASDTDVNKNNKGPTNGETNGEADKTAPMEQPQHHRQSQQKEREISGQYSQPFELNSTHNTNTSDRFSDSGASSTNFGQSKSQQLRPNLSELPKTRRVAYQGLCYTACFILCYVFPTTSRTYTTVTKEAPPYAIRLLAVSFVGSQGFLNWLVYFVQPTIHTWWSRRLRQREQQETNQNQPKQNHHSASVSSSSLQHHRRPQFGLDCDSNNDGGGHRSSSRNLSSVQFDDVIMEEEVEENDLEGIEEKTEDTTSNENEKTNSESTSTKN